MQMFERQDSAQILAEAVSEYCTSNPGLLRPAHMSPEAPHFFRCHDVAHVVFGCGTSLEHEAVVKIASVFGTTEGWRVIHVIAPMIEAATPMATFRLVRRSGRGVDRKNGSI